MWVDNMIDKSCASYLYQKRGVCYFSKQVPCDVRQHYKRDRIVICLKTKSVSRAKRMCDSILQRLHDYWLSLRLSAMPLPAAHLVHDSNGHGRLTTGPTLSEARDAYIKLKGVGKDKTFIRGASRNVDVVIKHLGDRPIDGYSSSDAAALRDAMLEKGLSIASVKRNFSTIRSIQSDCRHMDDDMRWLVALLSDTGMRLGEAVGLAVKDINLDNEIPHLNLIPHPWRRLKTKNLISAISNAKNSVNERVRSLPFVYLVP
jgi:hypothetical protein